MNSIVEQTVAFMVNAQGQALLGKKKKKIGKGKLVPPGGNFKPRESPRQCAVRETIEETQMRPDVNDVPLGIVYINRVDGPSILLYVFHTYFFDGQHEDSETLEEVGWYTLDQDTIGRMMDGDRVWIEYIQRGERFFAEVSYDKNEQLLQHRACSIESRP